MDGSLFEKSVPGNKRAQQRIVNAAGNDDTYVLFVAPYDCRLVRVIACMDTAIAAHATNFVTVTVQDGGLDGSGSTTIDDAWTSDSGGAGDTAAQFDETTIVEPSTPTDLSQGDIVKVVIANGGTGAAVSGLWIVEFDGG